MKKCLFVVGPEWANKYETCKNLISRNGLNDIILFDISSFLQRKYYKDGVIEDYYRWLEKLSKNDINKLVALEINRRLELNNINKIIITGAISYEDISQILYNVKIRDYNVFLVDATRELLYRNYSLNNNINISYDEFNKRLDELYMIEFNNLRNIFKDNDRVSYYYRVNNYDSLEQKIADYFGYNGLSFVDFSNENYKWPLLPRYTLLEHDKYGNRPVHMILGKQKFHSGFDIITETLTPIHASIGGKVTFSGLDERIFSGQSKWNERYGNMVEIVDNFGRKEIYAHLRSLLVKEGDLVNQDDVIGLSGCSGGARVPHLHFEIRKINTDHSGEKNTINPIMLLPEFSFDSLNQSFKEKPYDEIWEKMLCNPWSVTDEDIPYAKSKKYIR